MEYPSVATQNNRMPMLGDVVQKTSDEDVCSERLDGDETNSRELMTI